MSSSNQFRLLHDFDSYSPDTLDLSLDSEAKTYWFKCFHRLVLKFEQQAAKSQNTDPTAVDRAAQFRNYYLSQLEQLQQESPSLNPKPLAIRDLLELNETSLRRFGFDDPWKEQKQLENQASIKKLSSRLQYIDQLVDTGAIWTEIIKGVLAGNMFDWGAQAVSQILENDENFGLEEALERIQKRPWLVDCLDQWLERIKGEPHKCATIFTDNSGIDIVLGILPLVRQLLLQKTKVILCANTKPALNDITYEELQQLVEQCCSKCRIIDEAYKTGMLQIFGNEQNGPCLDFRLLTEEPVASSPEEKLYTFFNQDADKDKHNIYRAFNGHEVHNTFEGLNTSRGLDDLKAMSVASLYEGDDSAIEMNTVRPDDSKSIGSSVNLHCATEARIVPTAMPLNHTEDILHPVSAESNECPCNPYGETPSVNNSLYFADGIRSVDFVLVWKIATEEQIHLENVRQTKRFTFEQNLISDGLELEREVIENEIHFIKIHAPLEVLRRYSEILKLRMPMKEIPGMAGVRSRTTSILSRLKGFAGKLARRILVEEKYFPPRSHRFTAVYSRDKEYLFDLKQACFFTAAIRSRIVQFILDRKRFLNDSNNDYAFGIERLITDEVYIAAYPLHDGEITVLGSMRHLLYTRWAAVSKWYRYQPLDYIKEYFGVKIGLYFAWLGYYTYMLLLASIVGVICFVYSWKTLKYNTPSEEICSKENIIKMCPLCDHWCDYWELSETCLHARVTYLFDNPTTVLFAIFMSFWAALFLELWKRYSAEITHRWDLTGFDIHEEHPRPQYLARLAHVRRKKINAVTNTEEPQVPYWRMKLPATILSFSVVLLLVCLAIVAVLAVVLYRMSVLATLSVYGDEVTTSTAILFTTATAATINLCLIVVFKTYLAEWLTERELLRTQTEFDDSLTLKIYLLQFVNYYASIFYIAFFKGKFIGYPGNYNRFFNFRQEECGFGGCLMELCIQLGIIMIGKQAVNTALEMAIPLFYRWLNSLKVRIGKERNQSLKSKGQRFVKDLKLVEWGSRGLFPEYLEMVLQYGFVTIFVAAFPLAPLFALLNNILEMRLDAKKLLTFYRRPVSQRVRDIGIWYRILDSIGKLSVITNGFIIAFTSDFIPKFVYRLSVSSDGSLNGYLNYTLAYFNTSDFQKGSAPFQSQYNVTICRYPDFRAPPWSNTPYEKTTMYWLIMAARLAFVVIFENIVAIVMILVRWCIPDMSQELRDQIRREAYITNEIIIKQETLRARMDREADTAPDELSAPRFRKPKESGNDSFIQLERLISSNLSGSQLDLFIHSEREDQRKTRNDKVSPKFL